MKVKSEIWGNSERRGIMIRIDGEIVFDVFEDEPEDMILYRTLKGCLKVPDLLKSAYEAGKTERILSWNI